MGFMGAASRFEPKLGGALGWRELGNPVVFPYGEKVLLRVEIAKVRLDRLPVTTVKRMKIHALEDDCDAAATG